MNEDEAEKWQRFEAHMKQAEAEQKQRQPDVFWQRSIGCFIGGLLGPILLTALLSVDMSLHPDEEAGSPLAYFFLLAITVPICGVFTALITPFIVRQIKKLWKRISK